MRNSIIILSLLLLSCNPQKRFLNLIKKHPELVQKDSINFIDTVFTEGSKIDTTFIFRGDTIYLKDGKQEIKYFYNTTNHSHYLRGEVKPDTLIIEKKIPFEKVVVKEEKKEWGLFEFIIIIMIAFIIGYAIKKNP